MAWKEMTIETLARKLGVNAAEVREKQRLIEMISRIRKTRKMSQAMLAKKVGVSQSRIAQIESGIGTAQVSFDILLDILVHLGYDFRVITRKAA